MMHCKKCQNHLENSATACPQCLSPVLSVNILSLCKLFAAALCNPASMAFAMVIVFSYDFVVAQGSNVVALPLELVPLYLLLALFFFLLIFLTLYQIAKLMVKTSFPDFTRAYVAVHLQYLFLYVLYPLILVGDGMEGNVIGFLLLPAFILSQFVSLPLFFWGMNRRLPEPPPTDTVSTVRVTKGAFLGLAAVFLLALSGIFYSGQTYQVTGDQSRIPAMVAMQSTLDAVRDKDPEKFERHVNLRGILKQLQAAGGDDFDVELMRGKILAQIADGSALPNENEEYAFLFRLQGIAFGWSDPKENFRFDDGRYLFHPLGAVKKNNLFAAILPALYDRYGVDFEPEFEIIKDGDDYRIDQVANLRYFYPYEQQEITKIQQQEQLLLSGRRLSCLRIEPTETLTPEPIDASGYSNTSYKTQMKFQARIKNDSTFDFQKIEAVVFLRDRESKQVVGTVRIHNHIPVSEKNLLKAGDTLIWEDKTWRVKKQQVENVLSGRYELVALITEAVSTDKQRQALEEN